MILTSIGKRFVYVSILMMMASMILPWDSLEDYTYSESMGLILNFIPAGAFLVAVSSVILNITGNYKFSLLCIINAVIIHYMSSTLFGPIIAIILAILAFAVLYKPFSQFLNISGINIIFLLICLTNGIVLYLGMQYYPDSYTVGYFLFPSSIIVFMLGVIFSTRRIDGTQNS